MKRKINKSKTLNQVLTELKQEGISEITRILPYEDCFIVEWNN